MNADYQSWLLYVLAVQAIIKWGLIAYAAVKSWKTGKRLKKLEVRLNDSTDKSEG